MSSLNAKTITVNAGQTVQLATGIANAATAGTVTVAHSATDTTSSLVLNGYQGATGVAVQALTTTGAATTTYNVTSQGAANAVSTLNLPGTATTVNIAAATALTAGNLVAGAAKAVNITGVGNVTINGSDLAATVTVDASASTGKVAYTAETAGSTLTFTGGSGNDSVNFAAGTFTTADRLVGGAGTDTIVINEAVGPVNAATIAAINAATGFEVVRLGTTGATLDVGLITNGINSFATGAGNIAATFNNSLSTTTYTIDNSTGNTGTVAISNKTGEFTTTVTIDAGAATSAQTLGTLTLTGANVINLVSTGTKTGGANTITNTNTADNVRFNITGDKDLTITNAIDGAAVGSTIDASAFTGKLSLTGTGFNDLITGGTGADTILGGSGVDTITLGAGNDTVRGNAGADVLTGGAGADRFVYGAAAENKDAAGANVDRITDFVAGTDRIALDVTGSSALDALLLGIDFDAPTLNTVAALNPVLTNATTVANIADVFAQLTTTLQTSVFAGSGAAGTNLVAQVVTFTTGAAAGTYLVINDSAAAFQGANDLVINITGISGTFSASDIMFI